MKASDFSLGQEFRRFSPGNSPKDLFVVEKVGDDYIVSYLKSEEKYEVRRQFITTNVSLGCFDLGVHIRFVDDASIRAAIVKAETTLEFVATDIDMRELIQGMEFSQS